MKSTLAEVEFYDELAEQFQQAIRDAVQHPIIVIISSCRAQFFAGNYKYNAVMFYNKLSKLRYFYVVRWRKVDKLASNKVFHKPKP